MHAGPGMSVVVTMEIMVAVSAMVSTMGGAVEVTDVVDGVTPRQEQALEMRDDGTPERQWGDATGVAVVMVRAMMLGIASSAKGIVSRFAGAWIVTVVVMVSRSGDIVVVVL